MTAEFAVVLPAVLIVLALVLGSLALASTRVAAQDAAGMAARALARGSDDLVADLVAAAIPGATLDVTAVNGLVCATVTAPGPRLLAGLGIRASGHACALAEAPS